jgi:hypothetical protein
MRYGLIGLGHWCGAVDTGREAARGRVGTDLRAPGFPAKLTS